MWDQAHLVGLVQQNPQIAIKYFGEEQQGRSTSRESYEQLYRDNSALSASYAETIANLKEERDLRVKAERDAVWKDVAFTAAHKLGNPVFALETNLQGLKRKIPEKPEEALEIANEMDASIEKSKSIIEQFKSLTKAQSISQRPIDLLPIIETAARVAQAHDVKVEIITDPRVRLASADPTRIAECFDELFANALHWLRDPEKHISVKLDLAEKKELPSSLDDTARYIRIRFQDNGDGVPPGKKDEIFAPFYTTYPHGTGLGLALIQRVVEGHGGTIREVGTANEGAVFEIFLPQATPNKQGK